ncbi:M23 family metallopeptidase [Streptomyces sp. VRA16 Mangrove soil]|uniref:M23 family metallopeptidase n=1 Tax=Streptomyces sp. VRA16 Mangrove soil TaxID=2817434 RepID=UPI001A9CC87A|nr:M23 family metallopeptidase [Streptomyces sp. VRA16 Mangrove soil]MBO1336738.1 peptidoglycan DD-metalloendopeptidase family protein [Streptomyces sp. VRA16 Mangrove soil]
MRPGHRRSSSSFVVPAVLLCLLLALGGTPALSEEGPEPSARVARLLEEASTATQHYEEGRKAAAVQKGRARKMERLLARERREIAALHDDLGRIARAQYRSGGDIPLTAQMLLSDRPEELMHGQRAVWQADLAVNNAVDKSRRAEHRLAVGQRRATAAWHALEARNVELARMKDEIRSKLETARQQLQSEANQSAAAGQCRGAVRLDQPELRTTRAWLPPVEHYALSAGFDSAGAHWAHRHTGQDFAVSIGTPVRAVGAGRVVSVSCGGGFGIEVVVQHPGGYYTQYAHLAAAAVDQGQQVSAGQWIGQSGTTGNSTGPHLHFEVRLTPYLGSGIDPVTWFAERGVRL